MEAPASVEESIQRLRDLIAVDFPIIQAPMAGVTTPAMAVGVAQAGGLGSLPCAMLTADQIRASTVHVDEPPIEHHFVLRRAANLRVATPAPGQERHLQRREIA